jgi:GAF domain-containing protein
VDEQAGRLHLNACAGIPDEAARQIESLDFGVAVCGCAARDGCRIVAEHVQAAPDPRTDLVRGFGIQAYACHPLMNQGKTTGTLSFGSQLKPAFTEDELGLMKAVADHVAIAMQRVRLLDSLERHARAAEAANAAKSRFLANMSLPVAGDRDKRTAVSVQTMRLGRGCKKVVFIGGFSLGRSLRLDGRDG